MNARLTLAEQGLQRHEEYKYDRYFTQGTWLPTNSDRVREVFDAATEERIASVRAASVADVETAIQSAHTAFATWRNTPVPERVAMLRKIKDFLSPKAPEIASAIAMEVGTSARMSLIIQAQSAIDLLGTTADLLETESFEEKAGNSTVAWEPVGVVAAITPWNYPRHFGYGVCLLGCSVVLF